MTPALDALLKEVEALDRSATPGPWRFVRDGGAVPGSKGAHPVVEFCEWVQKGRKRVPSGDFGGIHIEEFHSLEGDNDATGELLAHYRTAAPRLAAMLRIAVKALREAVDAGNEMFDAYAASDGGLPIDTTTRQLGAVKDGRAALSRIESIAKGKVTP